jgi:hypothetical protein
MYQGMVLVSQCVQTERECTMPDAWRMGGEVEEGTKTPLDRDACRVRIIAGEVSECLTLKPARCPYAMSFGHGFFCQYLKRRESATDS